MSYLPKGWSSIPLSELVFLKTGPFGSTLHQSDYVPDGIPLVNPMHIADGRIVASSGTSVSVDTAERLSDFRLRLHDVVLGRRGEMGRCAVVSAREVGWLCGTGSLIVRPNPIVLDADFLQRLISSDAVVKYLLSASVGSTMANLNQEHLLGLSVNLPPLDEQTRIVEKLEELLSDLDAGVAELKAAQKKLGQYRQSLLKAAVEGALTAEWRSARKVGAGETAPETGAQLLERILTERRARWEAKQRAKFAEQGKTPPKDWQKKYPEPVRPDTSDVPELPEGWVWASVDQLSEIQGGIQKQPSRAPITNKYPYLRVANVARGQLKLEEIHEIELFDGELERLALKPGDVLVVEGNGSLTEIGRCALWDGSIENAVHQNHLIRVRPIFMESAFVETWLNSSGGIERLTKLAATTSGLYTLSVGKISRISVPVPPLGEQGHVIEILMTALDEQLRQQVAVEFALKQSAAQRKNILKAAFSGQLVPQDPNDEPASVLLERIRAERVERDAVKRPRGRKVKEAA